MGAAYGNQFHKSLGMFWTLRNVRAPVWKWEAQCFDRLMIETINGPTLANTPITKDAKVICIPSTRRVRLLFAMAVA
jgi:hypothetical protein